MAKKNFCPCGFADRHLPTCSIKNQGLRADFSDFEKVWKKLEKDYSGPGRNPARIREILQRLEKIWLKNSDLRLGQLILNFFLDDGELYYLEDKELIERLEERYLKKRKK
ncbi:MAG: hypothetical protein HYY86_01030 [Candidatus Harrisonbacteria bacterium]|nr:hypothetical protein [Candidatus Harrisonbacteria bacterium]